MRRTMTALVLCFALALAGCSNEVPVVPQEDEAAPTPFAPPELQEFTLPYYPDAELHPIRCNNRANMVLTSLVYQGLFELDNSFAPHGVLCAEHSVSDDRLLWTFTLSEAVFSDGSPVTAADVVHSLENARAGTLYAQRFSSVQAIRAEGDKTVLITLSRPNHALPALLDIPVIRDLQDGSMPLGTGPYRFAEDDGPLRLIRTSRAPDSVPEEIPLLAMDGADDLIYAFDAGNVSLSVSDLTGANALGYSTGYEAFDFPTTTMLYVGFQTTSGPCVDPLVRQAISRSFDRTTVAGSLLAGHAEATCLPFSPRSDLYSPVHEQAGGYDPTAAEALLADGGYTWGEDGLLYYGRSALQLTFLVNTDNPFKLAVADYLAGQLADLGFEVVLQKLAWDDYLAALEAGIFDLYLGEVALTADFDLTALLAPEGPLNYGGYVSEETNLLLTVLRTAGLGETAFLNRFLSDAPIAPLCFKNHSVLTQWQAISGLEPTRQNPFYHLENLRFNAVNKK